MTDVDLFLRVPEHGLSYKARALSEVDDLLHTRPIHVSDITRLTGMSLIFIKDSREYRLPHVTMTLEFDGTIAGVDSTPAVDYVRVQVIEPDEIYRLCLDILDQWPRLQARRLVSLILTVYTLRMGSVYHRECRPSLRANMLDTFLRFLARRFGERGSRLIEETNRINNAIDSPVLNSGHDSLLFGSGLSRRTNAYVSAMYRYLSAAECKLVTLYANMLSTPDIP